MMETAFTIALAIQVLATLYLLATRRRTRERHMRMTCALCTARQIHTLDSIRTETHGK